MRTYKSKARSILRTVSREMKDGLEKLQDLLAHAKANLSASRFAMFEVWLYAEASKHGIVSALRLVVDAGMLPSLAAESIEWSPSLCSMANMAIGPVALDVLRRSTALTAAQKRAVPSYKSALELFTNGVPLPLGDGRCLPLRAMTREQLNSSLELMCASSLAVAHSRKSVTRRLKDTKGIVVGARWEVVKGANKAMLLASPRGEKRVFVLDWECCIAVAKKQGFTY
jgi:hypothetical protein